MNIELFKALKSAKAKMRQKPSRRSITILRKVWKAKMEKILARFDAMDAKFEAKLDAQFAALSARMDAQKSQFIILGVMITLASIIISATKVLG